MLNRPALLTACAVSFALAASAFAGPAAKPPQAPKAPAAAVAPAAAPATADPVARTQAMVAAFQKVPARTSPASRAAVDKAFADLDGYLDFDTLTHEPIRPHLAKFDAAQRAAFAIRFREVVRLVAYPDSGEFFRKATLKIGAPRAGNGGTWVDIAARLPEDGSDTKMGLLWRSVGGALRIADLTFDGDSLVRDYQNQFGRILDKEGAAGLLKRLDSKKAELIQRDK